MSDDACRFALQVIFPTTMLLYFVLQMALARSRASKSEARVKLLLDAAERYCDSLRMGVPVFARDGARSLPFQASAEQSVAAYRDLKEAIRKVREETS
jgi:hypothetical protein